MLGPQIRIYHKPLFGFSKKKKLLKWIPIPTNHPYNKIYHQKCNWVINISKSVIKS